MPGIILVNFFLIISVDDLILKRFVNRHKFVLKIAVFLFTVKFNSNEYLGQINNTKQYMLSSLYFYIRVHYKIKLLCKMLAKGCHTVSAKSRFVDHVVV